jgi:Family of unknown function (DUF6516)
MKASRILHSKISFENGTVQEMVIWKLPAITVDRPHGLKYCLHYGLVDGSCLVRYDNEKGKGDHRHLRDKEEPYSFTTVRKLVEDFLGDVAKVQAGEL